MNALCSCNGRRLLVVLAFLAPLLVRATPVFADDWGCQVLLCLSDPRGPETESECVPPIKRLWKALAHGDPFPSCDFNSSLNDLPDAVRDALPPQALANLGAGTGASNTWAGSGYCRTDLLYRDWDNGQLLCRASGAINVTIDGTLYTRVWWGLDGWTSGTSITEYYGPSNMVGLQVQQRYDPAQAAKQFLQLEYERLYGTGGGGG